MLKKRYTLIFIKQSGNGKLNVQVPMFLYRKHKKFYIDYALTNRSCINWFQAWFWYWRMRIAGRHQNTSLFAYKKPNGMVQVRKLY